MHCTFQSSSTPIQSKCTALKRCRPLASKDYTGRRRERGARRGTCVLDGICIFSSIVTVLVGASDVIHSCVLKSAMRRAIRISATRYQQLDEDRWALL
ncbi:hypothetical protein PIIN_09159 [Serendipita indica DSM 11827]|uniref:Uncharacterized protein n=1 Tax=Serendipita indica (strain DSM 11827) TaxID=1109443 RepID=G4TV32_SERID|nr:hypothetical protein PIIN_09159 [Serendipita indica DSM 11827]